LSNRKSKVLSELHKPIGRCWSPLHSPQPDSSSHCETTCTGL